MLVPRNKTTIRSDAVKPCEFRSVATHPQSRNPFLELLALRLLSARRFLADQHCCPPHALPAPPRFSVTRPCADRDAASDTYRLLRQARQPICCSLLYRARPNREGRA